MGTTTGLFVAAIVLMITAGQFSARERIGRYPARLVIGLPGLLLLVTGYMMTIS